MANCSTYTNSTGNTLYHLRRIGPPASKDGVVSIMDLYKPTYMIGRNAARVDFYIDSSIDIQSQSLSRCHARVVRQAGNQHRIYDDSLNGIYVNNMKIAGSCILNEGDKVIFGHPSGARLPAGSRSRQPNSEHQFMFEMCSCTNQPDQLREGSKETFKKPVSPRIRSPEISHSQQKYTQNNTETNGDISSHQSPPIQTQAPPIQTQTPPIQTKAPPIQTQPLLIQKQAPPIQSSLSCSTNESSDANVEAMDISVPSANPGAGTEQQSHFDDQSSIAAHGEDQDNVIVKQPDSNVHADESVQTGNKDTDIEKLSNSEMTSNGADSAASADISEQVRAINFDSESHEQVEATNVDSELPVDEVGDSQDHNVSELEVTVNSILSDLCTIRGAVENDCSMEISSELAEQLKSPTKDVSIQTTQRDMQCILSPTKDMGIQTSQVMFNDDSDDNPGDKSEAVTASENSSKDHVVAESVDSNDDNHDNTSNQVCKVDSKKEGIATCSQNQTMENSEVDINQHSDEVHKDGDSEGMNLEGEPKDIVVNAEEISENCSEDNSADVTENDLPNDEIVQQKVDNAELEMSTVQQENDDNVEYQILAVEQNVGDNVEYQILEVQQEIDDKAEYQILAVEQNVDDKVEYQVLEVQQEVNDTEECEIPVVQQNDEDNEECADSNEEAECVLLPKLDTDIRTEVDKMPKLFSCFDSPHLSLSDSIAYDDENDNDAPVLMPSNSMEFDEDFSNDEDDENGDNNDESEEDMEEISCENIEEDCSNKVITCDSEGSGLEVLNGHLVDNPEELNPDSDDGVAVDNEENSRKRKMSSEISDIDSEEDNARKRHCSETVDVLEKNSESADMEVDQQFIDSDSNKEKEANVSPKNLEQLKDGMKRFFSFRSENASVLSSPGSSEYVFFQDRSGKVQQLNLDVPVDKQDVVDELGRLENPALRGADLDNGADMVNICDDDVEYISQASLDNGAVLENIDDVDETSQVWDVGISDNFAVNRADTDSEFENRDDTSLVTATGLSDNLAANKVDTDRDLENKDEEVLDEITSVSSDKKEDGLETYIQSSQLDEDLDNDDETETCLYPAVIASPLKQADLADIPKSSDSSYMSPILENCGVNPVTEKFGVNPEKYGVNPVVEIYGVNPVNEKFGVNSTSWLSTLPLEQSNKKVSNDAEVSGCEFTDDDNDDDFPSPEIDFNYMSDDYGGNWSDEKSNDSLEEDYDVMTEDFNNSDNDDLNDNKSESDEPSNDYKSENDDDLSNKESDAESVKIMGSSTVQGEDADSDNVIIIDEESAKDADSEFDKESAKDADSEFDKESAKDADSELDELLKCDKQSNDQGKNIDKSFTLDFDFCDSESDDIKSLDNGADTKEGELKRKSNSHSEDVMSKKTKTGFQNEDLELCTNERSVIPFKTPTGSRHKLPAAASHQSPGVLSCTQLMECSQSPDLDSLSSTQLSNIKEQLEVKVNDTSRSKDSSNKAKNLLERLRARKRVKEEAANDSDDLNSDPTDGAPQAGSSYSPSLTRALETQVAVDDINKHVQSCRLVVDQLKSMFERCNKLRDNPRVQAWRRELNEVEKRIDFAKTVIAVVGDTGAGKSSLMNAVLDHRSVLPTSGMRACTAVVVEVIQNTESNEFVADIEFLQRKEWFDELQILLNDLRGLDGTIKNRSPDPTSDAYVSYCKVKAVYGRIDNFNILSRLTMVTHWLGLVKVIRSRKAEDFRKQVEKYIETQEPTGGGQYWPIVKHVTLKIPNCDVCSTGASLVDLPGVRDSNAARDKIAREYLKNCTAVWVVSSIHRAIDDKTAKDLLGENFRRQLLMDGQYGSIAFICTKTDVIIPSEIIRSLKMEGKTGQLEEEIKSMEAEKCELDLRIIRLPKEIKSLTKQLQETRQEKVELEESLAELKSLLADCGTGDSSQSDEKEAIKEYEDELTAKTDEIEAMETRLEALIEEKQYSAQKVLELEGKLNAKRKTIAALCAEARNEYSKSQIRRDFKAGLKEMKRRAGMLDDDDNEEDIYSDDDDDDGDIGSNAENLKVFCCSSTEYQKMKNLLTDDGPPQVFSTLSDTQIPALRSYVHEMTSIRRRQSLERLIRNLGSFVFDVQTYLTESGDTKFKDRQFVKSVIDSELENFNKALAPVVQQLMSDIDDVFDGSIRQKLEQGASNATSEANDTCIKWGAPVNRDKNSDKRLGGLHFQTYRATVRRQGVFKSPTYGNVDFNEDLTEPMYRSLTIVWDRAFSGLLWKILDKIQGSILGQIKQHCHQLGYQLVHLGIPRDRINRVSAQLEGSASNKLKEMVGQLKDTVTNRQRDISRLITPHIQTSLTPIYDSCAGESGTGMYMRIKTCMSQGIDSKRMSMFDEATLELMQALIDLQNEIIEYVRQVTQMIIGDLRTAFEPLWDTPGNSHLLKAAFMRQMLATCSNVRQIYDGAGLTNTEERTVQTTAGRVAAISTPGNRVQQASAVRIKVETTTTTACADRTMNNMPGVHTTSYIKQEKKVFEHSIDHVTLSKPDATQFGIQTLQDLQDGKLDISPVEVTVQSTPHSHIVPRVRIIHTNPHTQVIKVQPTHQKRSKESSTKTLPVSTVQVLSQNQSAVSMRNPTTSSPLQYGDSNPLNYGLLHTFPDGSRAVQPYNVQHLPSGQKILMQASTSESSVGRTSVSSIGRQNVAMKSILKSELNTPLTINKENHASTSRSVTSCQPKVIEKPNKKSLSLSQRNNDTPVKSHTVSNIRIKTEPADNGTYGRRRPKYLGTIDLTDD